MSVDWLPVCFSGINLLGIIMGSQFFLLDFSLRILSFIGISLLFPHLGSDFLSLMKRL